MRRLADLPQPPSFRARLANALVALAARLDATATRAQRQEAALSPAKPA